MSIERDAFESVFGPMTDEAFQAASGHALKMVDDGVPKGCECPACGCSDIDLLMIEDDLSHVRCSACGEDYTC